MNPIIYYSPFKVQLFPSIIVILITAGLTTVTHSVISHSITILDYIRIFYFSNLVKSQLLYYTNKENTDCLFLLLVLENTNQSGKFKLNSRLDIKIAD